MRKTKTIKFDYGRIYSYKIIQKDDKSFKNKKPLKLEKLLEIALTKSIKERTRPYYGEDIIMQEVKKLDNELWEMQFIRQRSAEVPGIIDKKKGEFNSLKLNDSEYVGEDISVLYHQTTNVLMVQRNRNAIGINALSIYFQQVLNNCDGVEIKLVPFTNKLKEFKNIFIRKIEISFADVNVEEDSTSLLGVITHAKKMNSFSTKISYSIGHGNNKESLTPEEVIKFTELREEDGFKKVHIAYKESEDSPIEEVEFINGTLFDREKFEYSKSNDINYNIIIDKMIFLFKKRKSYLETIFRKK